MTMSTLIKLVVGALLLISSWLVVGGQSINEISSGEAVLFIVLFAGGLVVGVREGVSWVVENVIQ